MDNLTGLELKLAQALQQIFTEQEREEMWNWPDNTFPNILEAIPSQTSTEESEE